MKKFTCEGCGSHKAEQKAGADYIQRPVTIKNGKVTLGRPHIVNEKGFEIRCANCKTGVESHRLRGIIENVQELAEELA